jgi:hypothetical protein
MAGWEIALLVLLVAASASWLLVLRARLEAARAPLTPLAEPAPADLVERVEKVEAGFRAFKLEAEAYFEALEDVADTTERRRRRIAARESRKPEGEAAAEAPPDRLSIMRRARAMGHPV